GRVSRTLAVLRRPRLVEGDGDGGPHSLAFGERSALVERPQAARISTGEGIAGYETCNLAGMPRHVEQRLHGCGRDSDEMVGRSKTKPPQHGFEVVDQ